MPFCPICKYEYDDSVSACPHCGSDLIDTLDEVEHINYAGDETGDSVGGDEMAGIRDFDMKNAVLLYRSYSRLNTDFLIETLKSAGIPFHCRIIGGFYGRGSSGTVGFFGTRPADAEIYVPPEYQEEAEEIRRQTVGDE